MKNFLKLVLGCLFALIPMLILTPSAGVALGAGITVALTLLASFGVSLIPKEITTQRARVFVILITAATCVTLAQIVLRAFGFSAEILKYMPLCAVSALILFYRISKAPSGKSRLIYCAVWGGIFTFVTFVFGLIREVLGSGSLFGKVIFKNPFHIFALPTGAVFVVAILAAMLSFLSDEVNENE